MVPNCNRAEFSTDLVRSPLVLLLLLAPATAFQEITRFSTLTPFREKECAEGCSQVMGPESENSDVDMARRDALWSSFGAGFAAATTIASRVAVGNAPPCWAISAEEASDSYDRYAPSYDQLDGGKAASALGIDEARTQLLRSASGRVLEIGVGTGLNIEKYMFSPLGDATGPAGVTSLTLVDISEGMLHEAKAKVDLLKVPNHIKIEFIRADATTQLLSLFGGDSFDTVVDTFSLCVMGNDGAQACLGQMANVVKKEKDGGRILLIENTRSSSPLLGWYQDVTAQTAATVGGKGCVYNQDVTAMIKGTPHLNIVKEESFAAGLFRSYSCSVS